jgi:chromosome segregation ATPase
MANLSKEQFDAMKAELLVIYDQLKDLKRDASRKSRDFDFDASYVQRNEQTIESLESRKKDLSASVEQKAKERVTLSEDSLEYFNYKIADLTKQLEDKKFEFDGYNLTYSQNAFVSSVNQFADEIQGAFGSVKEKFDMNYQNSAMTVKYEDKDVKFEKQVIKMYEKFYSESVDIKKSLESHQDAIEHLKVEIEEITAKHEDEISNLKGQMDAAKAAENHDLVKKIAEDMEMKQADFNQWYDASRRDLEYNHKELSYYTSKEAELDQEIHGLVDKVTEGIAEGRKFGGKVATIEEIYALGITNYDSGADLKAADAEVRAFKTDLEAFDQAAAEEAAMFEDTFKKALSDLGIQQAKIVKVEEDIKILPDVIAENNDKVAMIQNDIASYADSLGKYKVEIEGLSDQKKATELELAGLPVDADPVLIAKYEATIADITVNIESIDGKMKSIDGKMNDAMAAEKEANDLIAKSQAELVEAQAIEVELKANYDALKAEFNDSNIKRSQDVAAKEEQRKAKIDAIIAAEEAQSVADKFKAKFDLSQPAH